MDQRINIPNRIEHFKSDNSKNPITNETFNELFSKYDNKDELISDNFNYRKQDSSSDVPLIFKELVEIKNNYKSLTNRIDELTTKIHLFMNTVNELSTQDEMGDIMKELKQDVKDMNGELQKLITGVAVLDERMAQKFNSVESSLTEIKSSLKELVTNKRYNLTTTVQIIGISLTAIGTIATVLKLFFLTP